MNLDVTRAFDDAAPRYDTMVGLSPGYHAQLAASAGVLVQSLAVLAQARRPPGRRLRVVDLGCGSGVSTRALLHAIDEAGLGCDIVGVDASAGMLAEARAKPWPPGVSFVLARAEELATGPGAGPGDGPGAGPAAGRRQGRADAVPGEIDGVFAAYLLRNVPRGERDALLGALHRRLTPGGPLVVHDYAVRGDRAAGIAWTVLCWAVVVPLSLVLAQRPALFAYLWRSVLAFDSVEEIMNRLVAAGYVDVRARGVPGWQHRMVHVIHGRRPA